MKSKTFKQALLKGTINGVIGTAFAGSALFIVANVPPLLVAPEDGGHSQVERPLAKGSPGALVAKYNCWTGDAPKDMEGKMPGHVVVFKYEATAPVYAGSKMVGLALDQIFNHKDHGLEVVGFCR